MSKNVNDGYRLAHTMIIEDDFYFEEDLETLDFDMVSFEEIPMFEDFNTEDMPSMEEIFFEDFSKIRILIGTVLDAKLNTKAKNPAYIFAVL